MPGFLMVFLIALGSLLGLLLLLGLMWLLLLVRPQGKNPADKALLCDYAHRGLHDDRIPENSLAAFARACETGFGIELDIRLSRDGEVMVFHDDTLERMTGDPRYLSELSAEELGTLTLAGTRETIPTLAAVLALVDGRVPLLVELKGESFDTSLCQKAAALLRDYKGSFCIESFNPLLIKEMRRHLPDAFCGLLYTHVVRDKQKVSVINLALTAMAMNFLCKPNFIAYNEKDRRALPVRLSTGLYHAPRFIWTIRSRDALDEAHAAGACPIFERIDR